MPRIPLDLLLRAIPSREELFLQIATQPGDAILSKIVSPDANQRLAFPGSTIAKPGRQSGAPVEEFECRKPLCRGIRLTWVCKLSRLRRPGWHGPRTGKRFRCKSLPRWQT